MGRDEQQVWRKLTHLQLSNFLSLFVRPEQLLLDFVLFLLVRPKAWQDQSDRSKFGSCDKGTREVSRRKAYNPFAGQRKRRKGTCCITVGSPLSASLEQLGKMKMTQGSLERNVRRTRRAAEEGWMGILLPRLIGNERQAKSGLKDSKLAKEHVVRDGTPSCD